MGSPILDHGRSVQISPRFEMHSYKASLGGIRQIGTEDVKSVTRRGVDLSESLQVFAAASHTEHRRADPSAGSGDNCPSTCKRPRVLVKAGESGAGLIVLKDHSGGGKNSSRTLATASGCSSATQCPESLISTARTSVATWRR